MDQQPTSLTYRVQTSAFAAPGFCGTAAPAIPKISVSAGTRFASGGSSFARHLGQALRHKGLIHIDVEPAPSFMSEEECESFGYGVYSARYGDIYTSRQLLQMVRRAFLDEAPESGIWQTPQGRWVDAFRPEIEKNGFGSREEVLTIRHTHLAAVRKLFQEADVFAFTLDRTQTWEGISDGFVYPLWPGTMSNEFDPKQYRRITLTASDMLTDFDEFLHLTRKFNPKLYIILSVSPFLENASGSDEDGTMQAHTALQAAAESIGRKHALVEFFQAPAFEVSQDRRERSVEHDLFTSHLKSTALMLSHMFGQRAAAKALSRSQNKPAIDPHSSRPNAFLCDDFIIAQLGYSGG